MRDKNFFQRHPGADFYSLFWLVVFLILAGLGRLFPPLWIPALVALIYLLFRIFLPLRAFLLFWIFQLSGIVRRCNLSCSHSDFFRPFHHPGEIFRAALISAFVI